MSSVAETVNWLRTTGAIRERCGHILGAAEAGKTDHFSIDESALAETATYVAQVTRNAFPTLSVPAHSRWRHFSAGDVDRAALLDAALVGQSATEKARVAFDLTIVSVLLDAGAGERWSYRASTRDSYARSEGLAVASFDMFRAGMFSSNPRDPLRADSEGLAELDETALAGGFQVSEDNPLVGVAGRTTLMRRLGQALANRPDLFGRKHPRAGGLFDYLCATATGNAISASAVLTTLLDGLASIWPGGSHLDSVPLGDVWPHPAAGGKDAQGWVPFHKLSQWLTYSLIEPLERNGLEVTDIEQLTPLAEYRNGGLLIDCGVLVPKHDDILARSHDVSSELIIEWRALTVALLDRLAPLVRAELGVDDATFPLAKVLEGGTWRAGRQIASEKRAGGPPPIRVAADGTVF